MKGAYLHQPVPLSAAFPRFLAAFPLLSAAFPLCGADLRIVTSGTSAAFPHKYFFNSGVPHFWCPLDTSMPSWHVT